MGEMRDSDWSRENLLRSDWLPPIGAMYTTTRNNELNSTPHFELFPTAKINFQMRLVLPLKKS